MDEVIGAAHYRTLILIWDTAYIQSTVMIGFRNKIDLQIYKLPNDSNAFQRDI